MKRFTRMAALLLFGLMAAVNVSADDAENKWEWIGEEIVTGGKEFYIFNVKSNTFTAVHENPLTFQKVTI